MKYIPSLDSTKTVLYEFLVLNQPYCMYTYICYDVLKMPERLSEMPSVFSSSVLFNSWFVEGLPSKFLHSTQASVVVWY